MRGAVERLYGRVCLKRKMVGGLDRLRRRRDDVVGLPHVLYLEQRTVEHLQLLGGESIGVERRVTAGSPFDPQSLASPHRRPRIAGDHRYAMVQTTRDARDANDAGCLQRLGIVNRSHARAPSVGARSMEA